MSGGNLDSLSMIINVLIASVLSIKWQAPLAKIIRRHLSDVACKCESLSLFRNEKSKFTCTESMKINYENTDRKINA